MNAERDPLLQAIDEAMAASDPYPRALALVLEHFAADSGTIHTRSGDILQLAAASPGMPEGVLEKIREIPIGKGMAGLAAERRAPVDTCNLQADESGDVRPGARATGLQGSICVPCFAGEEVVGTLGIATHGEREFTSEETGLLLKAGRHIGAITPD